ncbi:MAG TPA: MOSC domain-containing protein [Blastocatellia bacterium]
MSFPGNGCIVVRMNEARLISIQVGMPQTLYSEEAIGPAEQAWVTGIIKEPVSGPVWLSQTNLAGDGQGSPKTHGGPEKAVCVYPQEHYWYWQRELDMPSLVNGDFGENFTTAGQTEQQVCIGDVFQLGEAMVQLSQPRPPCWRLARRWQIKDLALRVDQTGKTGWYLRVLQQGHVESGVAIQLLDRPFPEWTVATVNDLEQGRIVDLDAMRSLAACPLLSESWRAGFSKKSAK